MQELKSLLNRRYVVRNTYSKKFLAIIEATSATQAIARALQLVEVTDLFDQDIDVEVSETSAPMALPTFLDSYFDFLNQETD
ncbi:MAG: hypothetical protein ABI351_01130 [Herbaspirillum sp.]